jgi:protein-tyrosine phosphatase
MVTPTNTTAMIDIHCHMLPGVDDGAKDEAMALAMIEKSVNDGVTHIILTPHFRKYDENKRLKQTEIFEALKQTVKQKGIPVELYLGREVYYKDNLIDQTKHLAIDGSPYVLVEFSTTMEQNIEEIIFNLKVSKLKPIVAHVERYTYLNKQDYHQIRLTGGLLQVNAGAIKGFEGFGKRRLIKYLLKNQLVDVVATDAHNLTNRKPNLKNAYESVLKKYGKAYADLIFYENPKKIIDSIQR